jgi:hypothetical protein
MVVQGRSFKWVLGSGNLSLEARALFLSPTIGVV